MGLKPGIRFCIGPLAWIGLISLGLLLYTGLVKNDFNGDPALLILGLFPFLFLLSLYFYTTFRDPDPIRNHINIFIVLSWPVICLILKCFEYISGSQDEQYIGIWNVIDFIICWSLFILGSYKMLKIPIDFRMVVLILLYTLLVIFLEYLFQRHAYSYLILFQTIFYACNTILIIATHNFLRYKDLKAAPGRPGY
jgi:hypothetical protein